MGISRGTARLLLEEAKRRPFSGSLLELGKMFVFFTPRELAAWARSHGVALAETEVALSHVPKLAGHGCMDDRTFFSLLGCTSVQSSDVTDWEGADLLFDLNQPVPEEHHGRFDVVFEGGTIQHVFDLPQVFANVHALLRPGGRIIHGVSPSTNHVDHGFHMFSPTLFYDFYSANRYEINAFYFFDYVAFWVRGRLESTPWKIRRYVPGCLDYLSYGRFGNRQVGLFVVATKTADSTGHVIPQQGAYRQVWEESSGPLAPAPDLPRSPASRRPMNPLAYKTLAGFKLLRELQRRWGPKPLPPIVARY